MLTSLLCSGDTLSEALQAKRYQDALTLSEALLKTNPHTSSVWTARGFALEGLHRDSESISSFRTALRYSPDYLPAVKGAVEVSYRSHDRRLSSFLNQLLRLDPANAPAHGIAGVLAFESGNCPLAIQNFEQGGVEVTRNPAAYSLYGVCLLLDRRLPDAIAVFERVMSEDPDRTDVRFDLGYAQLLDKRAGEAVKTLQPLASKNDIKSDVLNLLASAETEDAQPEAAVAHLRQAIGIAPKEEQNYLDLSALYVKYDNSQAAAELVDLGLHNVPASSRLHAVQGVIDAQLGKYDEAATEFERANYLDPKSEYGAAGLGALYIERNQPDVAIKALRERLRKNPNDATLNYFLAQALLRQTNTAGSSNFNEARDALSKSLHSKPDFGKARALLGKLYVQEKDYEQAVKELRLASQYDPMNRMALSQLVLALRRLGREDEAAAALAKLKDLVMDRLPLDVDPSRIRTAR